MKLCNVYKSVKTTIIGVVISVAAVASVFLAEGMTWWDASIGVAIGLALIFSPDTLISRLSNLFSKNKTAPDAIEEPAEKPAVPDYPDFVDPIEFPEVSKTRRQSAPKATNKGGKGHSGSGKKGHNKKQA